MEGRAWKQDLVSRLFTLINSFSWLTVLPLSNKYFLERIPKLSLLVLSIVYYRVRKVVVSPRID